MKLQNSHVFLVSIFFLHLLLPPISASARLLLPKQDKEGIMANDVALARSPNELKDDMELQLMGLELEECQEKDEECNRRRMISEAHLDYIYTQHHKP
ncbi:hypothetical protein L6164_033804 [Bauhinia variegata]|uniref:Uncharacterized protein n=1 Tax=Bauhinia variegata TaxID=167791 RepID=A0ACB9KTN6_BAUVA|nr:hypothetical protein L6164_033804 [Bauhinia variegata]